MNAHRENNHHLLRCLLDATARSDPFILDPESDDETPVSFSLDRSPSQICDSFIKSGAITLDCDSVYDPFARGLFEILPSEILANIVVDWLTIQDISRLDIAACSAFGRKSFLIAISCESTILFGSERKYGSNYIKWLCSRSISIRNFQGHDLYLTDEAIVPNKMGDVWKNLTHMDLQSCFKIKPFGIRLIIYRCFNLTSLNLGSCRITDYVLQAISSHLPSLRSLGLMGNSKISDEAVVEVAKNCSHLNSLNLSFCVRITGVCLLRVFSHLPGLLYLQLAACNAVNDSNIGVLADFCPGIKRLDLDLCENISESGLSAVVGRWKLESIDLPCLHVFWRYSQFESILKDCPSLKRLGIRSMLRAEDTGRLIATHFPSVVIDGFSKRSTFIKSTYIE